MLVKMGSVYFMFWTNGLKGRTGQERAGTEEEQPTCRGKKVRVTVQNMLVAPIEHQMMMAVIVVSAPVFASPLY